MVAHPKTVSIIPTKSEHSFNCSTFWRTPLPIEPKFVCHVYNMPHQYFVMPAFRRPRAFGQHIACFLRLSTRIVHTTRTKAYCVVRLPAMMDEAEASSLRQLVSRGWKYHHATFDLYLKLSGVLLSEMQITAVVLPELQQLVQLERNHSSGDELRVRKANVDLSNTGLTDEMLNSFLAAWQSLCISCSSWCLKLQRNRLTGASLVTLGQFVTAESNGTLEELHATHQMGPESLTRSAVLNFLRKLSQSNKYPIWVKRRRCFRPVHLRLGHCGVQNPEEIAAELEQLARKLACPKLLIYDIALILLWFYNLLFDVFCRYTKSTHTNSKIPIDVHWRHQS